MTCTNCGQANAVAAKFCIACGQPLVRHCPNGHANPAEARFCAECGAVIQASAIGSEVQPPSPPVAVPPSREATAAIQDAEKREMTVLFADLVGSTSLAGVVDAEDYREAIARYIVTVEEAIDRFGGHVANYLGDGVLAYFGYPLAHEDDAVRACLAALEIIETVGDLRIEIEHEELRLSVRVGIHSGSTVIGTVGNAREVMAVGETLNMAARLQSTADADTAVISRSTEQLVARFFELEDRGMHDLKGISEPVPVHRIVRAFRGNDHSANNDEELPLVGRDAELHVLRERWNESVSGNGRVVVLRGEAGLGKSRLLRALEQDMTGDDGLWLKARAASYYSDTALRPIVELLRETVGVDPRDGPAETMDRVKRWTHRLGVDTDESTALLAATLGIEPAGGGYEPLAFSPQIVRQKTLDLLAELFVALAAERPLGFVIEAVHWADQTTLDLLDLLAGRANRASLMVVLSGRPSLEAPWVVDSEVVLKRLPDDQVGQIISNVAGGKRLPKIVVEQIVDKADGNPLYVEELTRNVLESGLLRLGDDDEYEVIGDPSSLSIPASLRELLMARLDRSSASRIVIQAAATIGRSFRYELLDAILDAHDSSLAGELDQLVRTGILFQRGSPPDATYTFRHALLHDAADASMTRKTRALFHDRIARILEADGETASEVVAHHLAAGGRVMESIPYWGRAGQEALGTFALAESINHLEHALALLEQADAPHQEIVAAELGIRTLLGVPLMLIHGFASEGVADNYRRLLELSEEEGNAAELLFPALWGLWTFYEVACQLADAEEMGHRLLDLAGATGDSGIELAAHVAFGAVRLLRGDVASARDHFEQGLAVYRPDLHAPLAMLLGQDGGAMCCSFLTWVHAHDGDIDRGKERAAQSLDMCRELNHLPTTGFVEAVLASFYCLIDEYTEGESFARKVIELGQEQGMPHWAAQGAFNLGWALEGQGAAADSIPYFEGGLEGFAITGTRAALTYFRSGLVAALIQLRELERAQRELDDLFEFVEETGERFYEAELVRLAGDIALVDGRGTEVAAAAFRRALAIAEGQGASGLARRAERSLAGVTAVG
jgi:class 3 adenylate cyclase/tetratricopeptide (TPR) repeat protein